MRLALTGLLVFLLASIGSMAQRPWIRSASPDVGTPPRLEVAANSIIAFDANLAGSIDQGLNWTYHNNVDRDVRGVTDYFGNVTISVSQTARGDSASIYFTQGGTTWSFSEKLDVGDREVVDLDAKGQTFYVVTSNGTIFARRTGIDELTVPLQAGDRLIDLEISQSLFAMRTEQGLYLSTDDGTTWTMTDPFSGAGGEVRDIAFRSGNLIAGTTAGVLRYANGAWTSVGTWEDFPIAAPSIRAIAADASRIIAFAELDTDRLQLYRLETGDTAWIVTGYEFPMDQPTSGRDPLVIDAGWAVTYQTSTVDADSTGLYRYNLNDFTGVKEDLLIADVHVRTTVDGLVIDHPWSEGGSVSLVDLTGREVLHEPLGSAPYTLSLPASLRGTFGVVLRSASGTIARTLILR